MAASGGPRAHVRTGRHDGRVGGALTQPLVVALLGVMSWRSRRFLYLVPPASCGSLPGSGEFWDDISSVAPAVSAAQRTLIGVQQADWQAVCRGFVYPSRSLIALCAMYFGAIYGWDLYLDPGGPRISCRL